MTDEEAGDEERRCQLGFKMRGRKGRVNVREKSVSDPSVRISWESDDGRKEDESPDLRDHRNKSSFVDASRKEGEGEDL